MATVNRQSASAPAAEMPWSILEQIEEQRAYPRLALNTSISFRNADGQHCKGEVADISPDGVQVRCNLSAAQMLHPAGGRICSSNAPIVQLSMDLPLQGVEKRLVLGGQLVYASTRDIEPRCIIGLVFLEQRPLAQKLLDQFFAEQMHPYFEEDIKSAVL